MRDGMLRSGAGMKKGGGMLLVVGGLAGYILRGRPAFSNECALWLPQATGRLLSFKSHTGNELLGSLFCVLGDRCVKISDREL